ncbi:Predicted membrane protein [Actinomyces bovis]|uniref:Predicted membrane protein n=2 Tax=Actinomyces bovis TaxID=1658 RepID=A0ABY1VPM1_9ACTO|nr:Predicted membrane protein [Actinomyces bovis]VEG53720.1 Predicted membrane protein [Actinomyces israelii]
MATSLAFVLFGFVLLLLIWELLGVLYLTVGAHRVWGGRELESRIERRQVREGLGRSWVLPLLASATGVVTAIHALGVDRSGVQGVVASFLAISSSLGVILSWLLLQVGFAGIYRAICLTASEPLLKFPGTAEPFLSDYLYFSFTVGSSFATSDVAVRSRRVRRVVLVHSVVAFFCNALVVAVAFQVLQKHLG